MHLRMHELKSAHPRGLTDSICRGKTLLFFAPFIYLRVPEYEMRKVSYVVHTLYELDEIQV